MFLYVTKWLKNITTKRSTAQFHTFLHFSLTASVIMLSKLVYWQNMRTFTVTLNYAVHCYVIVSS